MICQNKSLEKISLKDNGISNEGAFALFTALDINTRLTFLNLEKNDINLSGDPKLTELKNKASLNKRIVIDPPKK